MGKRDLSALPKFRDSSSFLYVERARVEKRASGIVAERAGDVLSIPCATLTLLMLGPGVSITHAAMTLLAETGCLVAWCGERGVRFYAQGFGETRSARNLLLQARTWADEMKRLAVVRRMYALRFPDAPSDALTLQQLRGMEGVRVRMAYMKAAQEFGIQWSGRRYDPDRWDEADPLNRALSTANACLYGICHSGIVSLGLSAGIGFIHTGRALSFVYDIADFYKIQMCVPLAFKEASKPSDDLERRVRQGMRGIFSERNLLGIVERDIFHVLDMNEDTDTDPKTLLFDDATGDVAGGRAYGSDGP